MLYFRLGCRGNLKFITLGSERVKTGIPENHTLSSSTSPYCKYRGVTPPPKGQGPVRGVIHFLSLNFKAWIVAFRKVPLLSEFRSSRVVLQGHLLEFTIFQGPLFAKLVFGNRNVHLGKSFP